MGSWTEDNCDANRSFRFSFDCSAAGKSAALAKKQAVERKPDDRIRVNGRRVNSFDRAGSVTS